MILLPDAGAAGNEDHVGVGFHRGQDRGGIVGDNVGFAFPAGRSLSLGRGLG